MEKRVIAAVIVLLILAGAGAGGYYYYQQQNNIEDQIEVSGNIEATEVSVGAEILGKLKELKFAEGDKVSKDDELAKIDDTLLTAQLDQAKAAVTAAQGRPDQTQLALAQANLNLAELSLKRATITAPLSGVVVSRPFEVSEIVSPGSVIYTIANLDKVTLVVYIPEDQLGKVKLDKHTDVQVDSFPNRVFDGKITKISDKAEFTPANVQTKEQRVSQVFAVTISIANSDNALKAGMPADATIPIK